MAFNWNAFQIGFFDDQTKQMAERRRRAQNYRDKAVADAEKSKTQIQKRKALADLAVGKANQLTRLGVTDTQIASAVASGPDGLFKFADEVIDYANRNNISRFTESQTQSLIDTPELMREDLGKDFTLNDFINSSYGLTKPTLGSVEQPDRGIFKRAFGIGEQEAIRAELDKDAYFEGYSIVDLNELASQEAYDSLLPGSYATFGGVDYDYVRVGRDFEADLAAAMSKNEDKINATDPDSEDRKNLIASIQEGVVQRYASMPYGQQFLNDPSLKIKERFPDMYSKYVSVKEKDNDIDKMISDFIIRDGYGDEQKVEAPDGKIITYNFTFDDNGNPTAGTLNGVTIPNQDAVERAFSVAQDQGLFKNVIRTSTLEPSDIASNTLDALGLPNDTMLPSADDDTRTTEEFTDPSVAIYDNPVNATYLIKIKGKLGTFRVKGEDLSAIPEVQIGKNVTIMVDDDPEKRRKTKSRQALERDFTPMGDERKSLVDKPDVSSDVEEDAEEVSDSYTEDEIKETIKEWNSSLSEFQKTTPKSLPSAFKRWAAENNVGATLTQDILDNLIKMYGK